MKKVLIIGFLHPYTISGGSFRTLPLAKYLLKFGWEPVVLTPILREKVDVPFRVVETDYTDALAFWKKLFGFKVGADVKSEVINRSGIGLKKTVLDFLMTRAGEILNYPDSYRGWQPFALAAAEKLLKEEEFGVMLTCHPTISHIIGARLKQKHNIPWIADFPDLWSQNHNYGYSSLRRIIDKRLEKKTLRKADVLTTVSEPWADKLRVIHKNNREICSITHGYNPAKVNLPPVKLTNNLTITYTGTIYGKRQKPSKLFAALKELLAEESINPKDIEVRFFGDKLEWLEDEIYNYSLSGIVKQYGLLNPDLVPAKQKESQILLSLKWEDVKESGWHSGKIYDYLAARRPVLAIGGFKDVISELLEETKAGIFAPDVQSIKDALKKMYFEYKQKGFISYTGVEQELNKYSHYEMSRKFANLLDELTGE